MKLNIKWSVFILLIFCIAGCEYELKKENIVDLELPTEYVAFNLSLFPEDDTIKVFTRTEFVYQLETLEFDFLGGEYTINGVTNEIHSTDGSFTLSPDDYPIGFDTLSIVFYTTTGTGSVADYFGAGGYRIEKKWLILFDNRPAPELSAIKSITEDGLLKIEWPKVDQYNFIHYELSVSLNSRSVKKIIYDKNDNYYIDSSFIGGRLSYRINTKVLHDEYSWGWGEYVNTEEPYPTLIFEDLGVDSLRIFWEKSPYKATYKLLRSNVNPDEVFLNISIDTSCTILHPGFGERAQFYLYTTPYYTDNMHQWDEKYDYQYHVLGQFIASNHPRYGYNHLDKVVYTNTYDDMECYSIDNLELLNEVRITNLGLGGLYSCATNSAKVAAVAYKQICVFENSGLSDSIAISYPIGGYSVDHFCLTNNDLIAIVWKDRYDLISILDKSIIKTIPIDDYPIYSKWACISTSKDGNYACIVTLNGLKLYNISGDITNPVYSDSRAYRSVYFNPFNSNELMLTMHDNASLEIRNVSDFSLIKTVSLSSKQVIRNIDPESNYLLLTDYSYLYIMDLLSNEVVFSLRSEDYIPMLFGNRLFSNSGYSLDISQYLSK